MRYLRKIATGQVYAINGEDVKWFKYLTGQRDSKGRPLYEDPGAEIKNWTFWDEPRPPYLHAVEMRRRGES